MDEATGTDVASHIHMHVLPHWPADANFVTVIGETRVLPETLSKTWERLREGIRRVAQQLLKKASEPMLSFGGTPLRLRAGGCQPFRPEALQ